MPHDLQPAANLTPPLPLSDALIEMGDGPDVAVLLHAAGSGPKALEKLGAALCPALGRVRIPSFYRGGHLQIEPHAGGLRAPVALAAALASRDPDAAGARRIFVGHSMGGLIALLAMLQGAACAAAVVYEPIVLSLLDDGDLEDRAARAYDAAVIDDMQAALADGDLERGVARFIEAYGEHPWPRLPPRVREDLTNRAPELLAQALATNATRLDEAGLRRLDTPVLVLHGSRSPDVTTRMARRLVALMPNARLGCVEGAGHLGPASQPQAVAAAIVDFLARLRPGA